MWPTANPRRNDSYLLAQDGTFLGKLSFNKYDLESISNPYGSHGSRYSATSIFNKYGVYGSKYSSLSPFNPYTTTPPKIILRGQEYGLLTKNRFLGRSVDPDGLAEWMTSNHIGVY